MTGIMDYLIPIIISVSIFISVIIYFDHLEWKKNNDRLKQLEEEHKK